MGRCGLWLGVVISLVHAPPVDAHPDVGRTTLPPAPATSYRAQRLTSPVRIDGRLDDAAWQRAGYGGLIQNEPRNGEEPIFPTEWWIAYDDDALYAAFRLHDTAPDSIDASVARRDASLITDEVQLELDTFNDDRTGFLFDINAGGYIFDAVMFNDGLYDNSWDAVWSSAARVDEQGWVAEMRIPFSQLRFPPASEQVWGVNVIRRVKRFQSEDLLFPRARNESGHISRYPDLVGIRGVDSGSHREGLVYAAGKGEYLQVDQGDPFNDGSEYAYDVGGDIKWGLTSNLTLNATINPDFGQVEVDPAVVNLSAFETFFPEKRPFFVQDSHTFSFGRDGCNNDWGFNWMDPMLLYSRRVGRSPQLGVDADHDYCDSPSATTILGAGKLSGKIGDTTIGALGAVTGREYHELCLDGRRDRELAEPLTGYSVVRATRSSADAHRAFGVMATSVRRDLGDDRSRSSLTRSAYAGGVDGWTYLDDDAVWAMRGYVAGSRVSGEPEAIDGLQRSSRRYYQRPDADHLDYDPSRTGLSGWSSRVMLNKQKGDYRLNTALGATSPGFEINDVGFQTRADQVNTHLAVGRRWTRPNGLFRHRNVNLASYWTWDFGGTRTGGGLGAFYYMQFANYWSIDGSVFYNPAWDHTTITRGGPIMRNPGGQEVELGVGSDVRKSWTAYAGGHYSWNDGDERYASGWLSLEFKPSTAIKLSVEPSWSWQMNRSQYVTRVEDPIMTATFGDRYVFADLDYREAAMSLRADCALSPWLTLQTYVQPLIAVGDYRRIKEFAEPGTFRFDVYGEQPGSWISYDANEDEFSITPGDGGETFTLSNPDFNFKSLRINLVMRWEYQPGSTIYAVWTRNGTDLRNPGRMDLSRDMDALLGAPSDDVFMIKVTRWFDF